jgi:hypothetical protein
MGDLVPVEPGKNSASTFMRCPLGHVRPYLNTQLRYAAKAGSPMKCAQCREESRAGKP